MNINSNVKSLQTLCLEKIVEDYNTRGASVDEIKDIVPYWLFVKMKDMQTRRVHLSVMNLSNREYCYIKTTSFTVDDPLGKILRFTPPVKNVIYIDDIEYNSKFKDAGYVLRAPREKTLSDYGYKPGEYVTIYVNHD